MMATASSQSFVNSVSHKNPSNSKKTFKVTPPVASTANPHLFNMHPSSTKVVTYRNVHPSEPSYDEVCDLITNGSIVVENIVQIYNPYLEKAYQLKKAQKKAFYGNNVREEFLFHGTKKENLNSICTFNFDWRLYGQSTGHKFGKGVSFSTNAMYASNYSDTDSFHKVMIVAKVLIAKACQGNAEMIIPPLGFDTSQKDKGIVVVKYEDNEFLPQYKLYYHIAEVSGDSDDYDSSEDDDDDNSDYDDDEEDDYDEEEEDDYDDEEDYSDDETDYSDDETGYCDDDYYDSDD